MRAHHAGTLHQSSCPASEFACLGQEGVLVLLGCLQGGRGAARARLLAGTARSSACWASTQPAALPQLTPLPRTTMAKVLKAAQPRPLTSSACRRGGAVRRAGRGRGGGCSGTSWASCCTAALPNGSHRHLLIRDLELHDACCGCRQRGRAGTGLAAHGAFVWSSDGERCRRAAAPPPNAALCSPICRHSAVPARHCS